MANLNLNADRRPIDIQALLDGGFFAPSAAPLSTGTQQKLGLEQFGLDDFSRETGIGEKDLSGFFTEMQGKLDSDPKLLEQLNQIRQQLGLPPVTGARQAGLQDPSSLQGEDLMALMVMWALQQQQKSPSGGASGGQHRGNLPQSNFSNVRPASWGNNGGGGSGSGGGGSGSGGGGVSSGGGGHNSTGVSQNASVPSNMPTGKGSSGDFLKAALDQKGDNYVFGAETNKNDANPNTFDCSELVEWAAAQAGVNIPDGSGNQESWCRQHGTSMSVDEAIRTPGALLFKEGHVAISLGDGRTIEAMGSAYGVTIGNARDRFTSGGTIPGMSYA